MAYIPEYENTVNVNYTGNIAPASAGQINNYTGAALSQVGNAVAGVGQGAYAAGLNEQQKLEKQDNQIWASNAYSQAVLDWNNDLNTRKTNLSGPGTGFSKQFVSDFEGYQNDLISKAPNKETKKILSEQLTSLKTRLGTEAQDYEQRTYNGYQVNQVENAVQNSAKASAATRGATAQDSIHNLTKMINEMPGIPQEQKFKLLDSMHNEMFNATIDTLAKNNPAEAEQYIAPAIGKYPAGSNESKVVQSAKSTGLSPLTALALMGSESGISATAKNPNSTSYGALQFNDETWKEYGGTAQDRGNIDKQIELGTKYIQDQQNYLRSTLGREPTPGELKVGVMFRRNADEIIKASPNTPIESIIGEKAAAANRMTGKTTGQVLENLNNVMSNQIKKYSGNENYLVQTASANQIFAASNKIQSALDQQVAAQKFTFDQTVADHEAMAMSGQLPKTLLSQQSFMAMYPKDLARGQAAYENYNSSMKVGNYINQLSNMTPQQAQQTYQSLTPAPDSPGFAQRAKEQQLFAAAMQHKAQALQQDPVNFINTNSSLVNAKYQTMISQPNNLQAKSEYYATLLGEQQKQGIPNPKLLSKGQEDSIIQQIQSNVGMNRANYINDLSKQYGSYWPIAARQLQTSKNFPEGTAAILSAPNERAAQQAALASSMDIKQLKEALPKDIKPADIDAEIQAQMLPFYNSLDATQLDAKTIGDMRSTINKLTYNYVRGGMSPSDAASTAFNTFLGPDKYNYVDNSGSNVTLRIPKKYNKDEIENNIKSIPSQLTVNDIDTNGVKLLKSSWTGEPNADGYLKQIRKTAIWKTNNNEDGAKLFFIGSDNLPYPVLDKNGKQIEKSFQELSVSNGNKSTPELKGSVTSATKNILNYIQGN